MLLLSLGRSRTSSAAGKRANDTTNRADATLVISAYNPMIGMMRPAVPHEKPIMSPVAVLVFSGRTFWARTMFVVTPRSNKNPANQKSPTPYSEPTRQKAT